MFRKAAAAAALFLALAFVSVFAAHEIVHQDLDDDGCPICCALHGCVGFSPAAVSPAPVLSFVFVCLFAAAPAVFASFLSPVFPRAPPRA